MTQTWDPQAYNREGSFVHKFGRRRGGMAQLRSPVSAFSILDVVMASSRQSSLPAAPLLPVSMRQRKWLLLRAAAV